jgi:hypothetical protein
MPSCYVCQKVMPRNSAIKRNVYTGASVGGFNFSSAVWLNVLLNNMFGQKHSRARSYYAQRIVCADCADAIDRRERFKIGTVAIGGVALAIIWLLAMLSGR